MIQKNVSKFGDCVLFEISHSEIKRKAPFDDDGVDRKKILKAQKMVEKLSHAYHDRALQDIKNLQISYHNLVNNLDKYNDKLVSFTKIAHDMREQGANYDYHMVTYVGDYLCRFTSRIKSRPTKKILDIINIHIKAIDTILTYKIKGRSDPKGDQILNGLEKALLKYAPDIVQVIHDFRKKEEKCDKAEKSKNNIIESDVFIQKRNEFINKSL